MKFFKPQIQLVKRSNINDDDDFFIHAVTICDQTNYRPSHISFSGQANGSNLFVVDMFLTKDEMIPCNNYFTPVAHSAALGKISFENGEGQIQVNILFNGVIGTTTVSTTEADDEARPMSRQGQACPIFAFK